MSTDHVLIDGKAPSTQLALLCAHCGGRLVLALPVAVDEMANASQAFTERHRACLKQTLEQVPM